METMRPKTASRWTCLDLFCGCGGFSLGMERAGFQCLAAILLSRSSRREEALTSNSTFRNPHAAVEQSLVTSAATTLWEAISNAVPPQVSEAVGNPVLN
jgi:site-specific DNA-cytosine methylase